MAHELVTEIPDGWILTLGEIGRGTMFTRVTAPHEKWPLPIEDPVVKAMRKGEQPLPDWMRSGTVLSVNRGHEGNPRSPSSEVDVLWQDGTSESTTLFNIAGEGRAGISVVLGG